MTASSCSPFLEVVFVFTYEVKVKMCVLLKISIAVTRQHNQELLGKIKFIYLIFPHHHSSFKKVSAGMQMAEIWGQEIILRPWGEHCLLT